MSAKRGRPPLYKSAMRRISVKLDKDSIKRGRRMGGGNLSLGIRLALGKDAVTVA